MSRPPAIPPPPATAVTSSVPSKVREELQEVMTSIWGKGQGKKIDKSKKFYAKFVQTYHAFMIHEFWTKLKN